MKEIQVKSEVSCLIYFLVACRARRSTGTLHGLEVQPTVPSPITCAGEETEAHSFSMSGRSREQAEQSFHESAGRRRQVEELCPITMSWLLAVWISLGFLLFCQATLYQTIQQHHVARPGHTDILTLVGPGMNINGDRRTGSELRAKHHRASPGPGWNREAVCAGEETEAHSFSMSGRSREQAEQSFHESAGRRRQVEEAQVRV
ncbi:unnamed protein product [Tetraodon nigroviridis]|uniref:(spotted green pufferfish) hypothetical protein n=1 Tax=Tetraodon nigroviridis TaxID=99883 RepID=Q4SBE0_TETNG|nr:unnamed protein product [Tetraodon nigroviridis]